MPRIVAITSPDNHDSMRLLRRLGLRLERMIQLPGQVQESCLFTPRGRRVKRVDCSLERHGAAILGILNEAIVNSTALYDYHPRPPDSMPAWFSAKAGNNYPVIGLESDAGELLGFASYGGFRPHAAYKYSVEHSVYVHAAHRGRGLGLRLMQELIAAARAAGLPHTHRRHRRGQPRQHRAAREARLRARGHHPAGRLQVRTLARPRLLPAAAADAATPGRRLSRRDAAAAERTEVRAFRDHARRRDRPDRAADREPGRATRLQDGGTRGLRRGAGGFQLRVARVLRRRRVAGAAAALPGADPRRRRRRTARPGGMDAAGRAAHAARRAAARTRRTIARGPFSRPFC